MKEGSEIIIQRRSKGGCGSMVKGIIYGNILTFTYFYFTLFYFTYFYYRINTKFK